MNFCNNCGQKVVHLIPENDNRPRYVCNDCETIHYENPNIVAGVLPLIIDSDGTEKVLMCRRAIEPRYGLWTLPAGFMENGETVEQAAIRESVEEANLILGSIDLYVVMSMPQISQVYMMYVGDADNQFSPGIESLETKLFSESEIPWSEIAFPVVTKTLERYFTDRKNISRSSSAKFPLHSLVHQKQKTNCITK